MIEIVIVLVLLSIIGCLVFALVRQNRQFRSAESEIIVLTEEQNASLQTWGMLPEAGWLQETAPDGDPPTFHQELVVLLNKHSMERYSDTPDWVLGEYMMASLKAFELGIRLRDGSKCTCPENGRDQDPAEWEIDQLEAAFNNDPEIPPTMRLGKNGILFHGEPDPDEKEQS